MAISTAFSRAVGWNVRRIANIELMWLTGRLTPDFKTIVDFRKDNGEAIQKVCRQFVLVCQQLELYTGTLVAIDGSKFKAVNNRDRNFTKAKMQRRLQQIDESIERYLDQIASADRQAAGVAQDKVRRLEDKIAGLRQEMARLEALQVELLQTPEQQISLTDPDARSIATSGRGTGMVGYNVQVAVDAEHHLIVACEVTNVGNDRHQLAHMARRAKSAMGIDKEQPLTVVADRGYYEGEEILACEAAGITPLVPKPLTSGQQGRGTLRKT